MKYMVKWISAIMFVFLLFGILGGCSTVQGNPSGSENTSGVATESAFPSPEPFSDSASTAEPTPAPTSPPTPTPDPTPTPTIELPSPEELDPETQPLLYDFVHGLLDWHASIHRDDYYSDVYILRNKKSPGVFWIDWYVIQASFTTPPRGSKIERVDLKDEQIEEFEKDSKSVSENRVITEGDWVLFCIDQGGDEDSDDDFWAGITRDDLKIFQDYSDGMIPPFFEDGSGWPRDWLLREPYYTSLKDEEDIDMKDPWWDEWNLEGVYYMTPYGEDSEDIGRPELRCIGQELFNFSFMDNTEIITWEDVKTDCDNVQYQVAGHYTPKPEIEYE